MGMTGGHHGEVVLALGKPDAAGPRSGVRILQPLLGVLVGIASGPSPTLPW